MPLLHPIKAGSKLDLDCVDPDQESLYSEGKDAAASELARLQARIAELQERFYIARSHKLLIVFQGMDTAGKSGTIQAVFSAAHPQGISVASFKRPTELELSHDYLWRIHSRLPAAGEFVLFDRSHYEDITAVRVLELVPRTIWKRRFEHIRDFERMLNDEGTIILKFFLHISREAQKERLEARLAARKKQWKFEMGDLDSRRHWDAYMRAYSDAIVETSCKHAPWYVVPGNRKWLRNVLVASIIVERLEGLKLRYPEAKVDPSKIKID
jgi:PPK2 family polyphosphate:nucleotide phosphotransferase